MEPTEKPVTGSDVAAAAIMLLAAAALTFYWHLGGLVLLLTVVHLVRTIGRYQRTQRRRHELLGRVAVLLRQLEHERSAPS